MENMLPEKLSGFFFFDGEHIESMSDELLKKKRSDNFKQAVEALVGLNAWQAAKEHFGPHTLKRTVTGKFISEIQDTGDGDRDTLDEDIDKQQRLLLNYEEKRAKSEADYQDADTRIRSIELKLQAMQGDIENRRKYGEFIHKIEQEELQQNIDQEETIKLFAKNVFPVLLLPIMKQALEELRSTEKIDKGIPHMHADTIKFLLDRGRCICGNDLKHDQDCINRMQDLMESLPPNNLGTMIGNFVKDIKIYARNADSLGENFLTQGSRYLQHDSKIEEYEAEKKVLQSKLEDISEVSSLNQRKKELETQKQKLRADIRQYDEACGGAKREMARLEKKRETIISNDKRNITNRLYYTYAKAAYDKLEKEYNIRVNQTRVDLENVINEIFADIYDSQIGIEIKEDYSIKTYLQNNMPGADNLEKNTAQSYAVIFAFIAGIIKMHMEKKEMQEDGLPMVMDAPLSAFDKDRIKRICEALPKIAQQIIIFIKDTDGDIAEEHMSNVIGKKWLIQADSQTSSRIVERG